MKETIKIRGLDCPNCAAELEELLQKTEGVRSASVSLASQTVALEVENRQTLDLAKTVVNGFEEVRVVEEGKVTLRLENLHCAACAMDLEDEIRRIAGVVSVQVDFITQSVLLEATDAAVQKAIAKANKFEKVRVLNGDEFVAPKKTDTKEILSLGVATVLTVAALLFLHFGVRVVGWIFFACAYLIAAFPVLRSTAKNLSRGKVFDENFLMAIASLGAAALGIFGGDGAEGLVESIAVLVLYRLGELLQALAVGSSRRSVEELIKRKSDSVTRFVDGKTEIVSPSELELFDTVLVKAGECVPVDGTLASGGATLDTKSVTGEPEPRELNRGDEVLSGCVNAGGAFEMTVTRRYEDSAAQRIAQLVENATAQRSAPEKFITKFARYYTPVVCLLALVLALVVPFMQVLISGGSFGSYFPARLRGALSFLVISCPCALVISVPLTYFSGIGACARRGILVKGADRLDLLASAKTFAFDKTGTLTRGDFSVVGVYPEEGDKEALLRLVAKAEAGSSHPFASAFHFVKEVPFEKSEEVAGRGVKAYENGEEIVVGNASLLEGAGVALKKRQGEDAVIYAAKGGRFLGAIVLSDKIKPEAKTALSALKEGGVERLVMLTGDKRERAELIANEVGVDEVSADLLPEDKLQKAKEYGERGTLVYVGDGVNDAPVMAASDVAVSMGKLGSGAAVEASDLVLISDDLSALSKGLALAKKTKRTAKENVVFSIAMKVGFMALGAVGILPLWLAVFADVGVMLLAVLHSLRIK